VLSRPKSALKRLASARPQIDVAERPTGTEGDKVSRQQHEQYKNFKIHFDHLGSETGFARAAQRGSKSERRSSDRQFASLRSVLMPSTARLASAIFRSASGAMNFVDRRVRTAFRMEYIGGHSFG
jgi:hypothetical protein